MNYIELHIGDYETATTHLSALEDGIYNRLLRRYYARECPLPGDISELARIARVTKKDRKYVAAILNEFFSLEEDGYYHNIRADEEIARYQDKCGKAQKSAAASVRARFGKEPNSNPNKRQAHNREANRMLRSQRLSDARNLGTHTELEWTLLLKVCQHQCVKCKTSSRSLDLDHIIPLYQGGSDSIDNIQPLCAHCNTSKGPETTDYRPTSWQSELQQLLNERSTDVQKPLEERSTDVELPSPQSPYSIPQGKEKINKKENFLEFISEHFPAIAALPKFRDTWLEWLDLQQSLRKPMTKGRARSQLEDLQRFGGDTIAIMRNSLSNGYQGFFKPREFSNAKNSKQTHEDAMRDYQYRNQLKHAANS